MNYSIIYVIVISAVMPAIRSFILDVYGGMVAWDYMNGGRRFNCAQQKKKHQNDKKIPVLDVSHFLHNAKETYNDLKNYNDERERQQKAEAERQRQQREQEERQRQQREKEERERQEKDKQQKMEQERKEIENQKKLEAERLRLLEEKRLQMIREQVRQEEERKKQQLFILGQEQERERLKQLEMLERIKLIEEVKRLKLIVDQQQETNFVNNIQLGWKPPIASSPKAELCSANTPDERVDDNAWRDYIFDWKYDHCIITAYA